MTIAHSSAIRRIGNEFSRLAPNALDATCASARAYRHGDVIVISIKGEIDSTNWQPVEGFVRAFVRDGQPIVLDLSALEFLCAAGAVALLDFDAECRRAELPWALVTSVAVERAVRVVSASLGLPVARSFSAALADFGMRESA